jgi:hypothetical protein
LYEYSGEEFSTGSDLLDAIEDNTKINLLDYSLLTQDGLLLSNETGGPIIREVFNINTITQANNNIYQTESSSIIDFSELDPFSEGAY